MLFLFVVIFCPPSSEKTQNLPHLTERYPFFLSHSACPLLYRQIMSPLLSDWKSQGETRTTSPSLIHTLLFILPRILQRRSFPSWHFTKIRSNPNSFVAMPSTSLATGRTMDLSSSSLLTFFFPKRAPSGNRKDCLAIYVSPFY